MQPRTVKQANDELESKILSVSDVIEAMSSHRPYRAAFDMTTTKAEIIDKSGSYYCSECVEACLRLIEENNNDARRMFSSLSKVGMNN